MNTFSIKEAIRFGFGQFKKSPWFYVCFALVVFVLSGVLGQLSEADGIFGALFFVASFLFQMALSLSTALLVLRVAEGNMPRVEFLRFDGHRFASYIGASILFGIIVIAGTILLIVPGIYFAIRYHLYGFAIAERGVGAIEALKISGEITRGNIWRLIGLVVVFGLINVLGAIALGIGVLVTFPVTFIAQAYVYKKLIPRWNGMSLDESVSPSPLVT